MKRRHQSVELIDDMRSCLSRHPISLRFRKPQIEEEFLLDVALGRLPVFIATASFDLFLLIVRLTIRALSSPDPSAPPLWQAIATGLMGLTALYSLLALLHWRSQQSGAAAAKGELLLSGLIAGVLCFLITSTAASPHSWVFVAFFLICTTTVLRIRWFVGAATLLIPVVLCLSQNLRAAHSINANRATSSLQLISIGALPITTLIHLSVAWVVGCFMGFLSDDSRRQSFANHRLAMSAAATEVSEAKARVAAERALVSVQALAHAKTMLVDRERSANEAKSEFISMLCHEIRTPLNGCLASAEMLLQTDLNEDQKDLAHVVRVSGNILLNTVSNFLDYFKLEAGKALDIVRTPVHLADLCGDVHRIIEAIVSGGGGDVELMLPNLEQRVPSRALGDPPRLCGILLNMYMNSAKFTKRGRIGLKVHVVDKNYRPKPPRTSSSSSSSGGGGGVVEVVDCDHVDEDAMEIVTASANEQHHGDGMMMMMIEVCESSQQSLQHKDKEEKIFLSGVTSGGASATAAAASLSFTIVDEGSGWLSTSSSPPLEDEASLSTAPTPCSTISSNNNNENDDDDEEMWISFEVHDTGVGVPPKSLSALFHDYVQGDDAEMLKPRTRSGTGLGLAICGKQVAVLGGVIGALSKPGVGSIFWFKVPMLVTKEMKVAAASAQEKREEEEEDRNNENGAESESSSDNNNNNVNGFYGNTTTTTTTTTTSTSRSNSIEAAASLMMKTTSSSSSPSSESGAAPKLRPVSSSTSLPLTGSASSPLTGMHVLVVEDNMINRKVACRVLQSLGATCDVAADGQEAVDRIVEAMTDDHHHHTCGGIDAILMDMCMPVMGGVEASLKIRALGCSVPIVAMTANALETDREECLAAGMDGFLSKPVLREQLTACIKEVCHMKKQTTMGSR